MSPKVKPKPPDGPLPIHYVLKIGNHAIARYLLRGPPPYTLPSPPKSWFANENKTERKQ